MLGVHGSKRFERDEPFRETENSRFAEVDHKLVPFMLSLSLLVLIKIAIGKVASKQSEKQKSSSSNFSSISNITKRISTMAATNVSKTFRWYLVSLLLLNVMAHHKFCGLSSRIMALKQQEIPC